MTRKEAHLPAARNTKKEGPKQTPLEKAQARFNRLVKEIESTVQENKAQQAWNDRYHQLYQQKVLPVLRQYAAEKILLIRRFDDMLAKHKFSKADQRRYIQWTVETLMEVAPHSEEGAQLLEERRQQLYELLPKKQKDRVDHIREKIAQEEADGPFGGNAGQNEFDFDAYGGNDDPFSSFENFYNEQMQQPKSTAKKAALPDVDDIGPLYKELAKKLHPDLEQDEKAKAWKHELMQQLTEARKNRDLYTMLRIKGNLEDAAAKSNWSLEQLKRFNKMLEDKLRQLQAQFSSVMMNNVLQRGISMINAGDAEKEINAEIKDLKRTIKNIREDRLQISGREHLEDLLESLKWDDY